MKKKVVDLNLSFIGLDGKVMPGSQSMNEFVANALAAAKKVDAVKFCGWALNLNEGKALELDQSDFKTLKEFIENSEFETIIKAQILSALDEVKEKEVKAGK